MSGVKYLLDTNFILGMLKSTPEVLAVVGSTGLMAHQCAFSAITRMELFTMDAGLQSVLRSAT